MELFSELYSCYYQVVNEILRRAETAPLYRKEISAIVEEQAFSESGLTLLPRLLEGDWPLLEPTEAGYVGKMAPLPPLPLTDIQKSWLKALLEDPRIQLFLEEQQLFALRGLLEQVEPLFQADDFHYFDRCRDGDPYQDAQYQQHFRLLLASLKSKQPLRITFYSPKSGAVTGIYLPCRLEYSQKDDKFRAYVARVRHNRPGAIYVINLGRVQAAEPCDIPVTGAANLEGYFARMRCTEPVVLQIYPERNALERCMLQFASYEKRTEHDEKTDTYLCSIYYDRNEETELLIRILSFGPVVRVLGPAPFLEQVKRRVLRQHELLTRPIDPNA